jgi:hypothetical protein
MVVYDYDYDVLSFRCVPMYDTILLELGRPPIHASILKPKTAYYELKKSLASIKLELGAIGFIIALVVAAAVADVCPE